MDFKVIWAPSARLDLREIVSYIAEDNQVWCPRNNLKNTSVP